MVRLDRELQEHVALLVGVLEGGTAVLGHGQLAGGVVQDVLVLAGLCGHGERNGLAHGKLAFLGGEAHLGHVVAQDGGDLDLVAYQVAAALAGGEHHQRARLAHVELLGDAVDVEEDLVALAVELGGNLLLLEALDVDLALLHFCHEAILLG